MAIRDLLRIEAGINKEATFDAIKEVLKKSYGLDLDNLLDIQDKAMKLYNDRKKRKRLVDMIQQSTKELIGLLNSDDFSKGIEEFQQKAKGEEDD